MGRHYAMAWAAPIREEWTPLTTKRLRDLTAELGCGAFQRGRCRGVRRAVWLLPRDVQPNQVTTWKAQLEGSAAGVFGSGNGSSMPAAPAV